MRNLTTFNSKLDKLIFFLKANNNQTLSYFEKIKDKVHNLKGEDEVKIFFSDLSKIGTIAQYGDFSPTEEYLLSELLNESHNVSKK